MFEVAALVCGRVGAGVGVSVRVGWGVSVVVCVCVGVGVFVFVCVSFFVWCVFVCSFVGWFDRGGVRGLNSRGCWGLIWGRFGWPCLR